MLTGRLNPDGRLPITDSSELSSPALLGTAVIVGRVMTPLDGRRLSCEEMMDCKFGSPDDIPPRGAEVTPIGSESGRLRLGRPTAMPLGSPPGRPLEGEIAMGEANQTLMAFMAPPACVGSPELGTVHSASLGSPATACGGVLPQKQLTPLLMPK
jgi:hypothetical protein